MDAKIKKKKVWAATKNCYIAAYKKCVQLYDIPFKSIRTNDMQEILNNVKLSHATMKHIQILLNQCYKYAIEFGIVEKSYAAYLEINKLDDDEHGVPFGTQRFSSFHRFSDSSQSWS